MRAIVRGATAVAMTALLWLLLPVAAGAAPNRWAGTWQTAWTGGSHGTAEMILTQDGNTVSGTYDHLSGTIQGTATGDHFDGTWKQNNSSGSLSLVLAADGTSWSGTWTDKISGGGEWSGTCTAGDCLATAAPVSSSTTTSTTVKRPTAVAVQCDRDTNTTTNAHFNCMAFVNDIGAPMQAQKPTGSVTWTATKGQFLSGNSCLLVAPDVGASSCAVAYDAQNADAPIGSALPVTASYGGDSLFASSSGVHKLFPGPASSDGGTSGVPGWAIAGGAAAALAAVAVGLWWVLHSSASAGAVSGLVGGDLLTGGGLLDGLGIDGQQLEAALAQMTPADQRRALEQLSQLFSQGAGPPASVLGSTAAPAATTPTTPAGNSGGGGGMVFSPQIMAMLGPGGLLAGLGLNSAQLNAAISNMTPAQLQQVQQQLRDAFLKAAGH